MDNNLTDRADSILASRREILLNMPEQAANNEEEGGCGVTGFICSIPVTGKNIFEPSVQMHNRGNGKGGGVGAVGFVPEALGVTKEVLENDYMLQVALLDTGVQAEIENTFIKPFFKIDKSEKLAHIDDYKSIGLDVRPPEIMRYFVRVKEDVLAKFAAEKKLTSLSPRDQEDEFVYQNSFKINKKYYASLGDKQAFVMSHGRNMMILKIVGYAENVVRYYKLDDFKAHIWLAHQRYPTRGRVWHPGGCHPFSGLNEALVHNGDFANYQAVLEYLKQRNYHPLFLTDTEEAVLLLDLWSRVYKYPMEYLIEAMAPTSEMDFDLLPPAKQAIYKAIQTHHVPSSPDGPWFFIIARNDAQNNQHQLIGITDTAMLRPQVFALQEGEVQVGLICSEKQALDATLLSLEKEDPRFGPIADKYWNARGGSYTDGGAFIFSLQNKADGTKHLVCTDKFGKAIDVASKKAVCDVTKEIKSTSNESKGIKERLSGIFAEAEEEDAAQKIFNYVHDAVGKLDAEGFRYAIEVIKQEALKNDSSKRLVLDALTMLYDRRYNTGNIKRSSVLHVLKVNIDAILAATPMITANAASSFSQVDFATRAKVQAPKNPNQTLVINAEKFEPEGDNCDSLTIVKAYKLGWRRFILYNCRGQRFTGCGCGPATQGMRIDVYGSSGDYLSSGIDGMEIHVHNNAQDQLCQIMKDGKLVVYGDVGQTFMYGAKGGSAFIMGNAAGRPLINAVGKPRVIINGTALDYLAESFMAGDPLNGGGFVILNGIGFDAVDGTIKELESPYPGSNIFSLASGGAIYVRDPHQKLVDEQLNGGQFIEVSDADWKLIEPYLQENERLFGIAVDRLLTVDGRKLTPKQVYRKIWPKKTAAPKETDGLTEHLSNNPAANEKKAAATTH